MPRHRTHDEPDDDDSDAWPEADNYGDDELAVVPCPYCSKEIAEDAEQCPKCGNYISAEDQPGGRKPAWWVIAMILALLAAAVWTLGM